MEMGVHLCWKLTIIEIMFIRGASRAIPSVRQFSSSAVAGKDLVQELYMSQLKSYKAPAQPADAHVGHVKAFKQPAAPSAPSAPSDLAGELSTYESAQPSFTQQTQATGEAPKAEESADEFLSLLEADLPKPEVHH
ncbi:hypothetical protein E3P92_00235 [Wallemia ichthyophaga]|uniref:ATP synthase subunit H, mitochondrial n=2 Tax=Wallemia ichthyophaga TaxID=245174 RepID=A0A4T0KFJ2_WALIC|nr:uncharacterized protein J056_000292 [Wallemia ichthyophaga EXF-994]TIA75294.1 hypothetical protein E3P91_00511 [Wallemia ichthyophaga]EOR04934.1 hypothetical protein J056_000292 [Wallemia ichthyophaga EXF-994]TIA84076.1 hypothetical protein E3P98_00379 [Wallemia ichthyophaga]TIA93510.1 hypothetical protein E3P97_00927 [Wallemia ichthyophaga]TIA94803.1 hypothetical protein E3P96_04020 [Wallemia ichthyophaga]